MAGPKRKRASQVDLDPEAYDRLDRLVCLLSSAAGGVGVTRAAVVRRCIDIGMDAIEAAQRGAAGPSTPGPEGGPAREPPSDP
jgi:hypothetical protein